MLSSDALQICRALPIPAMILSGDGNVACANDAAAELLRYPLSSRVKRPLSEIADPTDVMKAVKLFSRTRASVPAVISFKCDAGFKRVRCDGWVLHSSDNLSETYIFIGLASTEQTTVGFIALNDKISELNREVAARKAAEEALRQSEQQFRNMADAIPQLTWMADGNGSIQWYNQRWFDYTGTTAEEMMGWGWQAVHDPKELPRVLQKWTATIRAGLPWEDSFPLRGKDGKFRTFLSRAFPIRDSNGEVVRWFGTNTDISEHLQSQELLRRTEKLAAAGRLAASIAHEINNPLEAVTNLLYLASNDRDVPEATREYLRLADEELLRVAHIARQTLGFYRETSQPVAFSIAEIFDEVLRLYHRKLTEKAIRVERCYRSRGELVGPLGEIRQVLANLVSNAIDAMNSSGRLILRISKPLNVQNREALRISVADEGFGIAQENLSQIFEPFFTTKKDVGTGLGLWVTKEIVNKYGGMVAVRSRTGTPSSGTIFSVVLPVELRDQMAHTKSMYTTAESVLN